MHLRQKERGSLMKRDHILGIGILAFGLAYAWLKEQLGVIEFMGGAAIYLAVLSYLAHRYGRTSLQYETTLMLDNDLQTVIPVSTAAFNLGEGLLDDLRKNNLGNTVIFRNGDIRLIESIRKSAVPSTWVERRLSPLRRSYKITTEFSDRLSTPLIDMLARVRTFAKQGATMNGDRSFLRLRGGLEEIDARLSTCTSWDQVFDMLQVPQPDKALRLLV
jgi:hypothetical protein